MNKLSLARAVALATLGSGLILPALAHIDLGAGAAEGKEWQRNSEIQYVPQEGPLKNLGLRLRNATVRSNFGNDLDENRLIVSYSIPLL